MTNEEFDRITGLTGYTEKKWQLAGAVGKEEKGEANRQGVEACPELSRLSMMSSGLSP